MYSFYKLTNKSISFISIIQNGGKNRTKAFAIAVAHCVSRNIGLPTGEVNGISEYYRLSCRPEVERILDSLNDCLVFDTKYARRVIEELYAYRYRSANPPIVPLAIRPGSGLKDFLGISQTFSGDTLEEIEKSPEAITNYIVNITDILTDLKLSRQQAPVEMETDRYVA